MKRELGLVFSGAVLGLILNIFLGRPIGAFLSTKPVLNRLNILTPQSPIVLHTTEQVRVSDTGDVLEALSNTRDQFSVLYSNQSGKDMQKLTLLNLTNDGWFLTVRSPILSLPLTSLTIYTSSQQLLPVEKVVFDSVTNLAWIKTSKPENLPVANFSSSKNLKLGEKVVLFEKGLEEGTGTVSIANVRGTQDGNNVVQDSSRPSRTYSLHGVSAMGSGTFVVSTLGKIIGVWDGSSLVSSDVLNDSNNYFLHSPNSFSRTYWGFTYKQKSEELGKIEGHLAGAVVEKAGNLPAVTAGSPAANAGLLEGDVIVSVNNVDVPLKSDLERELVKFKPGEKVSFTVFRGKEKIQLTISPVNFK